VATAGVVLSAIYLLWAYQQAFHHRPDPANEHTRDLNWREGLVMVPLVGLIIFLGVYPGPVLDRITPSVNALVQRVDSQTGNHQPVPGSVSPPPANVAAASDNVGISVGISRFTNEIAAYRTGAGVTRDTASTRETAYLVEERPVTSVGDPLSRDDRAR
jgi:hypothetical protein